MKHFFGVILCFFAIILPSVVMAQPVMDVNKIANTLAQGQVMLQKLAMLQQMYNQMQQVYSVIQNGSITQYGTLATTTNLSNSLSQYTANPCANMTCQGSPDMSSYSAARSWTKQNFIPATTSPVDREAITHNQLASMANAAQDGYAYSIQIQNAQTNLPDQATTLETAAKNSTSLDDDFKANTAVLMRHYAARAQILGAWQGILQVESAEALHDYGNISGSH